ncbi:MAG TPA: BTAD domain-containing putative transcriptional regulator [Roseiflexaceae bacterium]
MLTIQLFGSPQLFLDGRPVGVPRRKSRALLYYVAAHSAPVPRERLLALLWPDHDRPAAQQVLRTSLHGLRKAVGAALLVADDTLALAPDVDVDVRRFAERLAPPPADLDALAATLALYRGDFLAGFGVPDSESFDDWVEAERERYRLLALRGLTALAQQHEARRDYASALDALTRALALNPLQEDVQRAAMRLHYLAGDRAGAIRRYEALRRLLDDELGVPPMDETRALYDAIITDTLEPDRVTRWQGDKVTDSPPQKVTLSPSHRVTLSSALPFIGRAAELQKLREITSAHKLALIEGEPGIGKTRLADAFVRGFDGLALVGAARELEQALPYQPIIEALRGLLMRPDWPALRAGLGLPPVWLAEAARLLPELADAAGRGAVATPLPAALRPADESRLWEGISQLLLALARARPVALLLDDLHWADASTLALLGYLVRHSAAVAIQNGGAAPIAFLATARPVAPRAPLAALLQTLTREDRLGRLPLARLSADDTIDLARHLSPIYAYPLADWLARNAEGNPYILAELVRYARDRGLLKSDGTLNLSALSDAPVVPGTVYSLIQSRLARLSDPARRVLDAAVAVGREFDLDVVARAAGLSEAAAVDALDELRAVGLATPLDGLRYAFDHTLTMEVAFREIGEARHRLIHRHVAEALEGLHRRDLDPVAGLIASHFAEGNALDRAAHYAFRAGQRAADLSAWAEAIGFYQQALAGAEDGRRAAIAMALGDAYLQSGAAAQAAETFRTALDVANTRGNQSEADRARLLLARALVVQGRFAEAIALAQRVRTAGDPANAVSAELMWGTALSIEGVDLAGAAEHLQNAAAHCAAQGDPAILAQIRFELGSVAAQRGDLREAVARYREALEIAEENPSAAAYRILAHNNLAYHLLLLGDPTAIEHANAGLAAARESGMVSFQPFLLSTLGEIALAQGDLDAAERHFIEGLEIAEQLPSPERIAGLTANLGLVAIRRGQIPLAIHRLSTALARADALGTRHLAAQIRIWLAPLLPPAEAHAALAEARALAESGGRRLLLDEIARLENQLRVQS